MPDNSPVEVRPWPDGQPPSEAAIRRILSEEGLRPYQWSNGPGDIYGAHSHAYHKVIYVVQGAITFGLPDQGRDLPLRAGDRLELPPGVVHDAVVGSEGVICLEAHR
jgi:quercetin dioxygenase-like cupin family protein